MTDIPSRPYPPPTHRLQSMPVVACRQLSQRRKSSNSNSSAFDLVNSGSLTSTPLTQYPMLFEVRDQMVADETAGTRYEESVHVDVALP